MTAAGPVKIGMIVPSSNTALEPALAEMRLPAHVATFHMARARVVSVSMQSESLGQFDVGPMCQAASLLADARPDVLVWAGAAGLWRGLDQDRALCHAMTACTSVPAVTTGLALVEACRSIGAQRLGLVTPYVAEVVDRIVVTLATEGLTVGAERHLGLTDNHSFALVPRGTVLAMAVDCALPDIDAVVVACTNISAAGTTPEVERRAGARVLDSIAVTVWYALQVAGFADPGSPQHPGPEPSEPVPSLPIGGE